MGYLTREQIIQAHDLKTVEVACPEWADGDDVSVLVRQPSAGVMEEMGLRVIDYQRTTGTESVSPEIRTWFVSRVVVDADGKRLFTDADVELLRDKSLAPIQRIFEAGQELGGLSETELEDAKKN